MSARGTLLFLLLILGLVLTACGVGDSKKASASDVKAGTCIAKEVDDENDTAPDLNSVVDCSEPHVYEILDVVDLPDEALSGKTDKEKLANRKDLATLELDETEAQSDQNAAFFAFAYPVCDKALRKHAGYDDITVKGKSAEDVALIPALGAEVYSPWLNLMPKDLWLEGNRQFMCSVRYVEDSEAEEPPVKPVSSPNDKMLISSASSPSFPVELRDCSDVDRKDDAVSDVDCDERHTTEGLFSFDGDVVFGEKAMAPIFKSGNPTDEQMAPLDRTCTDSLPAVMGDGFDKKKIAGKAYVVEWDDGTQAVQCALAAVDFRKNDLGPGSFAWTDAARAKLVSAE
jgi:hypothetical protein